METSIFWRRIRTQNPALILPTRDGNYLEAYRIVPLECALILPTRDGNCDIRVVVVRSDNSFDPTYKGWKPMVGVGFI